MVVAATPALLRLSVSAGGRAQASGEARPDAPDSSHSDLSKGRSLFLRDCSRCHGKDGDGTSTIRRTLHPAPLDLTGFNLSADFILNTLHNGVPGSDMPAWHSSPETDLRVVSVYTARLGRPDTLAEKDRYAPPSALHDAGRRIYVMHCARCHGESGKGDGRDASRYRPAPPNFQGMQPSYEAARSIIAGGVRGTAMPSWPLLTAPEIQAVTYYIRSLYAEGRTEPPGTTAATE